jgi:hypothetical protein
VHRGKQKNPAHMQPLPSVQCPPTSSLQNTRAAQQIQSDASPDQHAQEYTHPFWSIRVGVATPPGGCAAPNRVAAVLHASSTRLQLWENTQLDARRQRNGLAKGQQVSACAGCSCRLCRMQLPPGLSCRELLPPPPPPHTHNASTLGRPTASTDHPIGAAPATSSMATNPLCAHISTHWVLQQGEGPATPPERTTRQGVRGRIQLRSRQHDTVEPPHVQHASSVCSAVQANHEAPQGMVDR